MIFLIGKLDLLILIFKGRNGIILSLNCSTAYVVIFFFKK